MSWARPIERALRMDQRSWERHANPWSAWTRVPILPLGVLALLGREWIGLWCLLPLALLAAWTWWNPRAFAPPRSTRSWASRAVMGERVWLRQGAVPIPAHHRWWADFLSLLPAPFLLPLAWGIVTLDWTLALAGTALTLGAKMWFLDRMVWLFDDMARSHPEYAGWLR
ncbi:MAG: DUF6653 family protein [Pseudomonadota bacterium]